MFWAYAPKTCRAKETPINYIVASSWHFTLFQVLWLINSEVAMLGVALTGPHLLPECLIG